MSTPDSNSVIYILSLADCLKTKKDLLCIVSQKGYKKARKTQWCLKWMILSVV